MLDDAISRDVAARVQHVRRRRGCTYDRWVPPPADWREIVRQTWPGLIRHKLERVPNGWCDLVLALADHLEGRSIVVFDAHEDLVTGHLQVLHKWRRNMPEADGSDVIIDAYEHHSLFTCRKCAREGKPIRRGTGRLATTKIWCDRHENGDDDER